MAFAAGSSAAFASPDSGMAERSPRKPGPGRTQFDVRQSRNWTGPSLPNACRPDRPPTPAPQVGSQATGIGALWVGFDSLNKDQRLGSPRQRPFQDGNIGGERNWWRGLLTICVMSGSSAWHWHHVVAVQAGLVAAGLKGSAVVGSGGQDADEPAGPSSGSGDPVAFSVSGSQPFREASRRRTWRNYVPLLSDLSGYSRKWFRADVVAGVTIATLAVPQSMAYAQTAGMPAAAGLYGLMLPVALYALLASSRALVTGPTATSALLVVPAVAPLADGDPVRYVALAAMLALLVGVVFVIARVAKLGWIADYFSAAVLLGFLTGLGLTLIAGQLDDLTGVSSSGDTPFQEYWAFITSANGGANMATALIGLVCLSLLIAGGKWFPRFPMLLVVTIAAIGLSAVADLAAHGVALVGAIPAGLPSLSWPSVSAGDLALLVPSALGLFFVSYSDAILTARSLAGTGLGKPVDANQELLALGGLNLAAGISGSFPLGSSGSRSAVGARLGGRTQVVGLVQVAAVALVLLFLTGALALLPKATLGAVIIFAAIGLINVHGWRILAKSSRPELLIAAVTVVGMLSFGLLPALVLAVVLSILDVVRRSSAPSDAVLGWSPRMGRFANVANHSDARIIPGLVIYRLDDRLFFANSGFFTARIADAVAGAPYPVTALIFDAEALSNADTTGAAALRAAIGKTREQGIVFAAARLRYEVSEQLDRHGLAEDLPESHRYPTVRAAVLALTGVDVQTEALAIDTATKTKE